MDTPFDMKETIDSREATAIINAFEKNMHLSQGPGGALYRTGFSTKILYHLVDLMDLVIHTQQLPYRIAPNGRIIPDSRMAGYMPLLKRFAQLVFHDVALSPDLELFQRQIRKYPMRAYATGGHSAAPCQLAELCNDFIAAMRAEGKKSGIKAKLKDWRHGATKNAKRLHRYLDALFERYARIMVVRLDLYYHAGQCPDAVQADEWQAALQALDRELQAAYQKEADEDGHADQDAEVDQDEDEDDLAQHRTVPQDEAAIGVDILTVSADWRRLMGNARGKTSLFRHRVGYVAAIECSRVGGHHLHVCFLFDGSLVCKDEYLAHEIGKYWIELTGGRGYYHCCKADQYKRSAVGMVNHDDHEKRGFLLEALRYLAKKDQFVRIRPTPKAKTFFTGQMPRAKSGRTGRPRGSVGA